MSKLTLMPTAAFGMPSGQAIPTMDVFAGACTIRETHVVTSPVATAYVSVAAAVATDSYLSWDNRQAKSAKWARPPRGETP
jgi:hypothetical protein